MDKVNTQLSKVHIDLITWTVLGLMPIVGMAVDLVAPSLPAIAIDLHVSASIAKNVISIYLFGYALGNFLTGFLTDALGRKIILRVNLVAFLLVSLTPLFIEHIGMLLVARFLQGLTLGAAAVVVRAILADLYSDKQLIQMGTLIGTMWGIGPILGPIIGGYLQFYFGWKAGFVFFAGVTFIFIIAIFFLIPETHRNPHPLNIINIKNNLLTILSNRLYIALVLLMGLVYSLMISFNTLGPFLIQHHLHYTSVFFGHLAFVLGIIFLSSTFICRYYLKKYPIDNLYLFSINLIFLIAIIGLILSYYFTQSILLIAVMSACMLFACGFLFPMSSGRSLALFRHLAGTSSATMYLFNVLIASFVSFLCSLINVTTTVSLMWIYTILMFLCFFVYWCFIHVSKNQ